MNKKVITAAAGLLLGAVALSVFLLRLRGHGTELRDSLGMMRYGVLAPALLFIVLMYILRIIRWHMLLSPMAAVTWKRTTLALLLGLLANNVLPARAGELFRPYVVQRDNELNYIGALSSVALDRILDLAGLLVLALLTAVVLWRTGMGRSTLPDFFVRIRGGPIVVLGPLSAATAVLAALVCFPDRCRRTALAAARLLPELIEKPAAEFINSFVCSSRAINTPVKNAVMLSLSTGAWFFQAVSTYFLALGLGLEIGIAGALIATIAVCLAVVLPQAPGFLGTYHLAASLAAESFDVAPGPAAAFAVVMWSVNIIPVTVLGLAALIRETLHTPELEDRT